MHVEGHLAQLLNLLLLVGALVLALGQQALQDRWVLDVIINRIAGPESKLFICRIQKFLLPWLGNVVLVR